jgi:hypothetical protein
VFVTQVLDRDRKKKTIGNMAARLASEELVEELASGRTSSFEISEKQRAFKMPPYLIFLCAILFAEEELYQLKSVLTIRDKRFAAFQKQYLASLVRSSDDRRNNSNNSDKETNNNALLVEPSPKIFLLTTGLHPTKELQAIVNRDLLKVCKKLESQANEAAEALLREEPRSSSSSSSSIGNNQQRTKSKHKQHKKKRSLQKIPVTKISPEDDEEEPRTKASPETIEEVIATKIQNSIVDSTGTVEEETSWVKIKKNNCDSSRVKEDSVATISLDCGDNKEEVDDVNASSNSIKTTQSISVTTEQTSMLHAKENIIIKNNDDRAILTNDLLPDSQDEENSSSIHINPPYTENISSVMKNASSHDADLSSSSLSSTNKLPTTSSNSNSDNEFRTTNSIELPTQQNERVAALEQNLIDLKQKLTEERIAHTNLIQGLQLRLYISETKLRTYEDALQNHIQAVSTLSCSITTKKKNDEELIPSSPSLLSKILENKSNNKIDDSHLGVNF